MQIRQAGADDIAHIAHIHIEGWKEAYGGLVPDDFLKGLSLDSRIQDWRGWLNDPDSTTLIAHDGADVAGFVSFGRLRTPPPGMSPIRPLYSGEIYALYILPAYWRRGIGRALLGAAAKGLREKRHKSLCLWVLDGNKRAISFYKATGGQRCGTKKVEIGGKILPEACFGWRDSASLYS